MPKFFSSGKLGEILAGPRPKEAYLNGQDLVVKLCYLTHEGTHLRCLQSRSTSAAQWLVGVWSDTALFYSIYLDSCRAVVKPNTVPGINVSFPFLP